MRLDATNANYWRTFCSPHIKWMEEHVAVMRARAMTEYEHKYEELEPTLGANGNKVDAALAQDIMEESFQRYRISELMVTLDRWRRERKDRLDHLAKFVSYEPMSKTFFQLKKAPSIESYISYAERKDDYCRGYLGPYEDKLSEFGFSKHIVKLTKQSAYTYVLWGNCYLWMFDAICRQITMKEAMRSYEKRKLTNAAYGLREFSR